MKIKRLDWPTTWLWAATGGASGLVLLMLYGAGLFRAGGSFLCLDDLEHVGAFVGGVFTPLAVGWAARSFILQREQTIEAFGNVVQQMELQRQTIAQQREQLDLERWRHLMSGEPSLQLTTAKKLTSTKRGSALVFDLTNHGVTAKRLDITVVFTRCADQVIGEPQRVLVRNPINPQATHSMTLWYPQTEAEDPMSEYYVTFTVLAERVDGMVSRFVINVYHQLDIRTVHHDVAVPGLTINGEDHAGVPRPPGGASGILMVNDFVDTP